ncbi:hypothetical protein [Candidatus Viridilinea mediisalina]|uniref:Uncharacterized protein n=1 Tax=Candidatus Viridilinea mediisalina TaxID=2024553 RepID=A0A2A6RQ77_9CHLR|nr:hypothetical protein [Candidatus Viridilinea mediisalina]PDW05059.1 hypothetical protein CJ255_00260 [Candidatus Viridilinea mediisalina]
MSKFNSQIQSAIDTFDADKARVLLREALQDSPDAETYYLASLVAINAQQQRKFLDKALELDPFHPAAHAALEQLDSGKGLSAAPSTPAEPPAAPAPPVAVVAPPPRTCTTTGSVHYRDRRNQQRTQGLPLAHRPQAHDAAS